MVGNKILVFALLLDIIAASKNIKSDGWFTKEDWVKPSSVTIKERLIEESCPVIKTASSTTTEADTLAVASVPSLKKI